MRRLVCMCGFTGSKNPDRRDIFSLLLIRLICDLGLSGHLVGQLSRIHLLSFVFFCKSQRIACEDLSACVASLDLKILTSRQFFPPVTLLVCDLGLSGHLVGQLTQIHLLSSVFFLQKPAHSLRRLVCMCGFTGSENPGRQTIFPSCDPPGL